jgi:hypothetical protein
MTKNKNDIYDALQSMENEITDLCFMQNLISLASSKLEEEDEDGVMNSLITLKDYLDFSVEKMDALLKNIRELVLPTPQQDYVGCGGDILTSEEEEALKNGGLKALFELKSPWIN